MTRRSLPLALLPCGLFLLAACDPAPMAAPDADGPAEQVTEAGDLSVELAIGETVWIESVGTFVRFVEVHFDERCPQDAHCVWAGNAGVRLRASRPPYGQQVVDLETHTARSADLAGGLTIHLAELQPVPLAADAPDPQSYRVTVRLEERG